MVFFINVLLLSMDISEWPMGGCNASIYNPVI